MEFDADRHRMSIGDAWPDPPGHDQEAYEAWLDRQHDIQQDPDYVSWSLAVHGLRLAFAAVYGPITVLGYYESAVMGNGATTFYFPKIIGGPGFVGVLPTRWVNQRLTQLGFGARWCSGCLIASRESSRFVDEPCCEMATCREGTLARDDNGEPLYRLVTRNFTKTMRDCIHESFSSPNQEAAATGGPRRAGTPSSSLSAGPPRGGDL